MQQRNAMAPLTDTIITAVSNLVDDARSGSRDPSHSDIEFQIQRSGLLSGDPRARGQQVGKAKRIRATLSWAIEENPVAGESLVATLISTIRGYGGFRDTSANFVGHDAIKNAIDSFRSEGYELTPDGELRPLVLDNLSGADLTQALEAYVRRAKQGNDDAALLAGTGKDLLEATAAHILSERYGYYSSQSNFPTLLGQVFVCLGLATPQDLPQPGEPAHKRLERALYETACAINSLRNKEGTGHGRPWLPSVTRMGGRASIESIGVIAEWLLGMHKVN